MTTDISLDPASAAGTSTENASPNADTATNQTSDIAANAVEPVGTAPAAPLGANNSGLPPAQVAVVGADGKTSYVPNYKYKAAGQEKELDDPFFRSLIKDAESEKKVRSVFEKIDAFDTVKGQKQHFEGQFTSLLGDYNNMSHTVTKFNESVSKGDLSSAFRVGGITKEQVFKWTQQQIQLMEMPPEQRAQYEQFEQAQAQKSELEERVQSIQQQFETQAVQNRTMQLDFALTRPEVARFAEAWDRGGEPGAFKDLVIEEAKKVVYESQAAGKPIDLSPEQAIAMVMQRFGKRLSVGDATMQVASQAIPGNGQRTAPPVIPNVVGKPSSPIKQVAKSLDDLRKIERSLRHT